MRDITTFYEDLIPQYELVHGFKYQPSRRRTGREPKSSFQFAVFCRLPALVSKSCPSTKMAASLQSMNFFVFFLALCCCSFAHAHPSVHRHRSPSSPKPVLSRSHDTRETDASTEPAIVQPIGEHAIVPLPGEQAGDANPRGNLLPQSVRMQMQALLDSPLFDTSDEDIDLHPPTIITPGQKLESRQDRGDWHDWSELEDAVNGLSQLLEQAYHIQAPAESPAASESPAVPASTAIVALTSTLTNTPDVETTPTSSPPPVVVTSTISTPSPTPAAAAPPSGYTFDPTSQSNNAVYYGQLATNPPLSEVCADPNIDIVIISFLSYLTNPPPANAAGSVAIAGWPTLNVAAHCWAPTADQVAAGAGTLVDCVSNGFSQQVQTCQQYGKKVLLSLGGAVGYSNTTLPSGDVATAVAQNVWDLFLGGGDDLDAIKPFGPDVVFDGIGESSREAFCYRQYPG